jgi:hypothetical protein
MTVPFDIVTIVLWLLILDLGVAFGAGVYEARIVVPLWGSAPPESLHSPDSGRRFWVFATTVPLTLLTVASALCLLTPMDEPRLFWWMIATALVVLERIATFAYFIPTIIRLQRADGIAWTDVRRKFALWRTLNYGRLILTLAAWATAMAALTAH